MLSQLVEAILTTDERAWKARPFVMMGLMGGFVFAGALLIVTHTSVAAGNAFLVSFLFEMAIWFVRYRSKPIEQEESR